MPIEELIPQEIEDTPAAIQATLADTRPAAREAAVAIRTGKLRRIYIIGNGTSLYTSMAATYTARMLAGEGAPFILAVPAGEFRYFMPAIGTKDVVVGMSASGEFRDVIAAFEQLRGKCSLVGITHVPGSSISKLADHLLVSSGGPSRVPVMTKTYASTLTALHLLLLEVFSAAPVYFDDLAASADRCEQALTEVKKMLPELVPAVAKFDHAFYFGAGNAFAASLEGALKMKEMALLHAEGSETWEMASGPATVVSEKTFCAALYTGDPSDASTAVTARLARQWGARLLDVGPQPVAGDFHLPVLAPAYPAFASLSLVPPLALLAYRVARARGQNPNQPTWRERYYSQGMTHILGE
ncbi:MAG: SIS domain-containing protein [Anaerolineales bacterium]|jgi:glucosamine--fructose-6-phosphate aminotransferase (isomerizing)